MSELIGSAADADVPPEPTCDQCGRPLEEHTYEFWQDVHERAERIRGITVGQVFAMDYDPVERDDT